MSEEVLKLYSSALSAHSNALADSTVLYENGHILSQEKKKKKAQLRSLYLCFKNVLITVTEKDQGKDFALFLFNMVYVVCLTAPVGN